MTFEMTVSAFKTKTTLFLDILYRLLVDRLLRSCCRTATSIIKYSTVPLKPILIAYRSFKLRSSRCKYLQDLDVSLLRSSQ